MKEQEQICENFIGIIENKNIQEYAGDAFGDFVQALFSGDVFSGMSAAENVKNLLFHIPTVIFWNKMQRFLLGTYRDWEEQVKMSSKFSKDNKKYKEFIYQLMETIDKLDLEIKVDYYSNLIRAFLLELIDENLFYKLRQIIMNCTVSELGFFIEHNDSECFDYDIMIFSLKNYGLVEQITDEKTYYKITDLAKRLKEYALNGENISKQEVAYTDLTPPKDLAFATEKDIENLWKNN